MGGQRQEDFMNWVNWYILLMTAVSCDKIGSAALLPPMKFNHKSTMRKKLYVTETRTNISLECEQNRRENQVGTDADGRLTKDSIGFPIRQGRMRNEETVTETANYHLKIQHREQRWVRFSLRIYQHGQAVIWGEVVGVILYVNVKFRTALCRTCIMREWLQMCDRQSVSFPFLRGGAFIHSTANSFRDLCRTKRKRGIEYCQAENELIEGSW